MVLVNGQANHELNLQSSVYRLRLLNGSNFRILKLGWSDARAMTVIGTDGGLLDAPLQRPYITYLCFFYHRHDNSVRTALEQGLTGTWLLSIVAAQSLSVLGTLLASQAGEQKGLLLFFNLYLYLSGGMIYILIITLIFYRFTFLPIVKENLTPPFWINMGAVAVTTLAGSLLVLNAEYWSLLTELLPFLKGFTLFFWATASWWIPLLLLGMWWHLLQHFPLRYDPQNWGMVFPFGLQMRLSCLS